MEIRDMDILAEVKDVQEALRAFFEDTQERQVFVTPANRRGNRLAVATLVREEANLLLGARALRVGFVRCRVRKRIEVVKCFRCLGYGHISQDCKGQDRRKTCFNCGAVGNKKFECTAAAECFLCKEMDGSPIKRSHKVGSALCTAFRGALEAAKRTAKARRR